MTLRSDQAEIVAFCWPCDLQIGDKIENRLAGLVEDVSSAYFQDWPEREKEALSTQWIERTGHYSYRGRGRVIDSEAGLIEVLGFTIHLGVPCYGHADFAISRLDTKV